MLSLNKLSYISKAACIGAAVSAIAACSSTPSTPLAGVKSHTLSNAVIYQTSSKEYPVLSSFVYGQAVPGVAAFIDEVVARNGKVALITNRNKALDSHTWNNLLAQGLPLTTSNTCVVGRTAEDKEAVGQEGIVNDKDLRRMQLTQGKIACSNTSKDATSTWAVPHTIIMQIGDNIEDVGGVTQESANVELLMPRVGTEIFILPNPMYGSW